jgi:hypothetical protein
LALRPFRTSWLIVGNGSSLQFLGIGRGHRYHSPKHPYLITKGELQVHDGLARLQLSDQGHIKPFEFRILWARGGFRMQPPWADWPIFCQP